MYLPFLLICIHGKFGHRKILNFEKFTGIDFQLCSGSTEEINNDF